MGCIASYAEVVHERKVVANHGGRSAQAKVTGATTMAFSPDLVRLKLQKKGTRLKFGIRVAAFVDTSPRAVIVSIEDGSLVDHWNASHEQRRLAVGDVVVEANGETESLAILNEVTTSTALEMVVHRDPPRSDEHWAQVSRVSQGVERMSGAVAIVRMDESECNMFTMPAVAARSTQVDTCAICAEDVAPTEQLLQLKCGHAYHMQCMTGWLVHRRRLVCPLCIRELQ